MSLTDEDIKFAMKFYTNQITSAQFNEYLTSRSLKFVDVEKELKFYGLVSDIQKTIVYSAEEVKAFMKMGEIVSLGDDMHFYAEGEKTKLFQSDTNQHYEITSNKLDEIFKIAATEKMEVSVRFGSRMKFSKNNKNRGNKNGENIVD